MRERVINAEAQEDSHKKAQKGTKTNAKTQRREAAEGTKYAAVVCLICMSVAFFGTAWAQTGDTTAKETQPYADLRSKPYRYHGFGREIPEPAQIETVGIGLFAPSESSRSTEGLSLRRGAELAIFEANSRGGLHGIPFELVIRTQNSPWGSAREVVKLVYDDRVWAIAGAIGGESSHVVQQIITKAQLPLVGTATTDASLTQINIGWTFRLMPNDTAIAHAVAAHLIQEKLSETTVTIASNAYDHRLRAEAFEKEMVRLGQPLSLSLRFNPGDRDFSKHLALIRRSGATAVVIWAGPTEGADLVAALPGFKLFAGPGLDRAEFFDRAGPSAEGLVMVSLCDLDRNDPVLGDFKENFSNAFNAHPDGVSAFAYDGVRIIIEAIRRAGLNRARIRDALAETKAYAGVTGEIAFDGSGANTLKPLLRVVHRGNSTR